MKQYMSKAEILKKFAFSFTKDNIFFYLKMTHNMEIKIFKLQCTFLNALKMNSFFPLWTENLHKFLLHVIFGLQCTFLHVLNMNSFFPLWSENLHKFLLHVV